MFFVKVVAAIGLIVASMLTPLETFHGRLHVAYFLLLFILIVWLARENLFPSKKDLLKAAEEKARRQQERDARRQVSTGEYLQLQNTVAAGLYRNSERAFLRWDALLDDEAQAPQVHYWRSQADVAIELIAPNLYRNVQTLNRE